MATPQTFARLSRGASEGSLCCLLPPCGLARLSSGLARGSRPPSTCCRGRGRSRSWLCPLRAFLLVELSLFACCLQSLVPIHAATTPLEDSGVNGDASPEFSAPVQRKSRTKGVHRTWPSSRFPSPEFLFSFSTLSSVADPLPITPCSSGESRPAAADAPLSTLQGRREGEAERSDQAKTGSELAEKTGLLVPSAKFSQTASPSAVRIAAQERGRASRAHSFLSLSARRRFLSKNKKPRYSVKFVSLPAPPRRTLLSAAADETGFVQESSDLEAAGGTEDAAGASLEPRTQATRPKRGGRRDGRNFSLLEVRVHNLSRGLIGARRQKVIASQCTSSSLFRAQNADVRERPDAR